VEDDSKALDESKIEQVSGGYEEPAVQYTGDDAETNGIFFIPVFIAANANVVVNANAAANINAGANANAVANVNAVANANASTNANVMDDDEDERRRRRR
jgi:hypothetical protein